MYIGDDCVCMWVCVDCVFDSRIYVMEIIKKKSKIYDM
jgi:hypothetical protein